MARRLVRNTGDAVLGGVAAGFGDYVDVDPVLVRLMFIVLCIAGGSGILLYLVCWVIMPRDDEQYQSVANPPPPPADRFVDEMWQAGERVAGEIRRHADAPRRGRLLAGGVLIGIGLLFLLDRISNVWWLDFWRLWPLLLIAGGVAILLRSRGRGEAPPPVQEQPEQPQQPQPPEQPERHEEAL